jgi:hypothetical protein
MSGELDKITNGLKVIGETILPGTSQLMEGNVASGAGHAITGIAARILIGPIGWGIVAANSFSKSVSGNSLLDMARGVIKKKAQPEATEEVPSS